MDKLSEPCNQEPIMEFEGYTLRPFDENSLWFQNSIGEGTQVSKIDWLIMLDCFFKDKF